jgi:hypothetical protein
MNAGVISCTQKRTIIHNEKQNKDKDKKRNRTGCTDVYNSCRNYFAFITLNLNIF